MDKGLSTKMGADKSAENIPKCIKIYLPNLSEMRFMGFLFMLLLRTFYLHTHTLASCSINFIRFEHAHSIKQAVKNKFPNGISVGLSDFLLCDVTLFH